MPELFFIFGYIFYVTSFDKGEPFHVHIISRGKIKVRRGSDCSTKLWLGKFGEVSVAHNGAHIPERHLKKIISILKRDQKIYNEILNNYCDFFRITPEQVDYYKKFDI